MKYNNDSNTDDNSEYDDDFLFNSDDNDDTITDDNDDFFEKGMNESINCDSGYSSNKINVIIIENTYYCQLINVDIIRQSVQLNCDVNKVDKFGEVIWKYKALCYEDICLWIVKNPKNRKWNVLAMEIYLQYHKSVNNKLKLSVIPKSDYWILS